MDAIVIHCTVPDKRVAKDIAKCMLKYKMAACVSMIDKVESTFSWEGEVEKEREVLSRLTKLPKTALDADSYNGFMDFYNKSKNVPKLKEE